MNEIIKVLMDRDWMSLDEANDLLNEAKEEVKTILEENGTLEDIENVLLDYFGLEPDYIFDLIDL